MITVNRVSLKSTARAANKQSRFRPSNAFVSPITGKHSAECQQEYHQPAEECRWRIHLQPGRPDDPEQCCRTEKRHAQPTQELKRPPLFHQGSAQTVDRFLVHAQRLRGSLRQHGLIGRRRQKLCDQLLGAPDIGIEHINAKSFVAIAQ